MFTQIMRHRVTHLDIICDGEQCECKGGVLKFSKESIFISHCWGLEQDRVGEMLLERVPAVPQATERAAPVIQDKERTYFHTRKLEEKEKHCA